MFSLLTGGCEPQAQRPVVQVAPGIVFRRDNAAGVQILDVDMATAQVRPVVVAANVERKRNNFVGDAKTVREWAEQAGALGGLNGGFFGDTYDDVGRRKQIVQMAMTDGKVVAPGDATPVPSRGASGGSAERYLRCAVGFTESGMPDIAWAAGNARVGARRYPEPVNPNGGKPWQVRHAVACGPRLWVRGTRRITDGEERLISRGRLPRAFAAYDLVNGKPAHFVLGRADAMEFSQVASYLEDYFRRVHSTTPQDALCLDGGPSAQLVYRDGDTLRDAEATGVLVPTAILLLPKNATD